MQDTGFKRKQEIDDDQENKIPKFEEIAGAENIGDFKKLPNVIIEHIFSFLSGKDLLTINHTSRFFKMIAQSRVAAAKIIDLLDKTKFNNGKIQLPETIDTSQTLIDPKEFQ